MENLQQFLEWSLIINFSFFFLVFFMIAFGKKLFIGIHAKIFKISEEKVLEKLYGVMLIYKTLIIIFNLVPYLVILIIN